MNGTFGAIFMTLGCSVTACCFVLESDAINTRNNCLILNSNTTMRLKDESQINIGHVKFLRGLVDDSFSKVSINTSTYMHNANESRLDFIWLTNCSYVKYKNGHYCAMFVLTLRATYKCIIKEDLQESGRLFSYCEITDTGSNLSNFTTRTLQLQDKTYVCRVLSDKICETSTSKSTATYTLEVHTNRELLRVNSCTFVLSDSNTSILTTYYCSDLGLCNDSNSNLDTIDGIHNVILRNLTKFFLPFNTEQISFSNSTCCDCSNVDYIMVLVHMQDNISRSHSNSSGYNHACVFTIIHLKPNRSTFDHFNGTNSACSDILTTNSTAKPHNSYKIAHMIFMVFTPVSMASLVLVIVLHCKYPTLINMHGKCMVSFCFSLFLLQGLLFITDFSHGVLCVIVGILAHYFSLATFSWMCIMNFDLMRRFSACSIRRLTRDKTIRLKRYCIAGWGIPFLIVFTYVILKFSTDSSVGYAKDKYVHTCWIVGFKDYLVSIMAPFAFTLLFNVVCFVVTLHGIESVRKIGKSVGKERNRCSIYCRMFVVMGLTWTTAFVASFIPSMIFRYIEIFLTCAQGYLILISYIFNRTIRNTIRKRNTGGSIYTNKGTTLRNFPTVQGSSSSNIAIVTSGQL